MSKRGFWLEVSGDFACFTRPEFKAERVSYEVITPSAARGIFDSIMWKPAIRWQIREIHVLKPIIIDEYRQKRTGIPPIQWISLRRNEVGKLASPQVDGIFIEEHRQQKSGLFLRDVRYRIHGEFVFIPPDERPKSCNSVPDYLLETDFEEYSQLQKTDRNDIRKDETEAKYAAMFERRARKCQYFYKPFLGCREFAADVKLIDPEKEQEYPINETRDLGWMLYDMNFSDLNNIQPLFFHANMKKGIIHVPDKKSNDVKG